MRRKRRASVKITSLSRSELEGRYGTVLDTAELARIYIVTGFIAESLVVRRRADDVVGTLTVQDQPRFYYNFTPSYQHQGKESSQ